MLGHFCDYSSINTIDYIVIAKSTTVKGVSLTRRRNTNHSYRNSL